MRPDGTLYGEGQGIVMNSEGGGATWVGSGVGTIKKDGSVSYRGAIYYQTSAAKRTRLNGMAAVFEYDVDPQGNARSQIWEWKEPSGRRHAGKEALREPRRHTATMRR